MIKLLTLSVLFLFSCSTSSEQEKLISKVISVDELQGLIKEKSELQLVDVRTIGEYQRGHLSKSVLIDYYKPDFKAQLQKLDKDKPIAVYCAIGGRSNSTLKILKRLGFKEAYDLAGGIEAWREKKLPIEN
ncbi:rhodanese-like domain-containing protein [Roseivirga sp. E12]|uniref:rhodanese-like domain-containing protein n=1 Tax=Roseivirga sp. E12 TaxID=2819237 RepID=UPI001ABC3633|nr:rhodanese-like domain-containing protein [Roseivirga sp. E12]MBO3697099.1 rhodanese-like domain-containing protein [Roseivirga sp. E12]